MRARSLVVAALLAALLLSMTGCVRRRLTVRTTPPGAQVFIDDQEIGTTPCSASYVYYGTRKITLMKDGYRTETVFQKIPPPWYEISPLDFMAE
ncbi:MAG: PEGA domain-containing protein, partial [Planctomycetia bacterium]|nr:PEGA domain-containing protein [Planctomycetia bacterium]